MPLASRVTDLGPFDLLLSVARLGSLGAAARAHGISQPAASSRIKYLERRVGVALLERSPQGSRLTAQGALVADWARTALDAATALEAGITSLHHTAESRLAVAASMTIAEYLLPHWLVRFRAVAAAAPEGVVAVALTTGNSDEVAAAVLDGAAAIGFVEGPTVPPGVTAFPVGQDELTLIVHPSHPWARRPGRRRLTPSALASTSLVTREPGSGTRLSLERALQAAGVNEADVAAPLLEVSSTTAIKTAVAEGVAPAVLSSLSVRAELASGAVVAVPVAGLDLSRTLRGVYRAGRPLTGPARVLAEVAGVPRA
jgi:DNA-binding transcriptional LysR family regulator